MAGLLNTPELEPVSVRDDVNIGALLTNTIPQGPGVPKYYFSYLYTP